MFQRGCTYSFIFRKLFCGFPVRFKHMPSYYREVLEQSCPEGHHRCKVDGYAQPVPYICKGCRQYSVPEKTGNKDVAVKTILQGSPDTSKNRIKGRKNCNRKVLRIHNRYIIRKKQTHNDT